MKVDAGWAVAVGGSCTSEDGSVGCCVGRGWVAELREANADPEVDDEPVLVYEVGDTGAGAGEDFTSATSTTISCGTKLLRGKVAAVLIRTCARSPVRKGSSLCVLRHRDLQTEDETDKSKSRRTSST